MLWGNPIYFDEESGYCVHTIRWDESRTVYIGEEIWTI